MKKNRILSAILDNILASLISISLVFFLFFLGLPEEKISDKFGNYVFIFYYTILLGGIQKTPGTVWRHLKITTLDNQSIGLVRAWWRSSLYVASLSILTLGITMLFKKSPSYTFTFVLSTLGAANFLFSFWDKHQRCLHDLFSGTKVVEDTLVTTASSQESSRESKKAA